MMNGPEKSDSVIVAVKLTNKTERSAAELVERRAGTEGVPSGKWLELVWRILRSHEGIVSGGKVNWLINGLCGKRLPTIDLAHVDLP